MNTNGMSQVGAFTPDNLIAGNRYPVDVCHVIIKAGQNLLRGTVLEEDAAEAGKYVICGTQAAGVAAPENAGDTEKNVSQVAEESQETESAGTGATAEAEYILAEAVDASEEDAVGTAYRTGEFAENALIVKEGYTLTARDRKVLRNAGIFLTRIMM